MPGSRPWSLGGSKAGGHLLRLMPEAFRAVQRKHPDSHLLVIAGPRLEPGTIRQGLDPETAGRVTVAGYVKDLPAYLAASDLVVTLGGHTTLHEVLLRSRAPVVVCPVGKHWEEEHNALRAAHHPRVRVILREDLTQKQLAQTACDLLDKAKTGTWPPSLREGDPEEAAAVINRVAQAVGSG